VGDPMHKTGRKKNLRKKQRNRKRISLMPGRIINQPEIKRPERKVRRKIREKKIKKNKKQLDRLFFYR